MYSNKWHKINHMQVKAIMTCILNYHAAKFHAFRMLTSHYCSGFKDSSLNAVISRQEGPSIPNVKFLLKSESIWNLIFVVNLIRFKMTSYHELQYYIYIYAFSRRFYPKAIIFYFFLSMGVPWELNPRPFALLTQCSTTEPQEQDYT